MHARKDPKGALELGLERDGPPPGGHGLDRLLGTQQEKRQRRMRLGQIGVKFKPDSKATPEALKAAAGKEFLSNDPAIRAVKPVIAEILIGY